MSPVAISTVILLTALSPIRGPAQDRYSRAHRPDVDHLLPARHGAVASMKPAGKTRHPGLRPSRRDPQWRPRPAVPVLDGPQCRVPGRAELRLFKPGHPRCPQRCSVVRCGRKLLEPWTTAALATGEPALRSFVTGLRADQDAVTASSHGHEGAAAAWFGGLPVIGARKHPKRAHLAQTSSARGDAEPVRWLDPEVTRW